MAKIKVAIIDSGIDSLNPFLKNSVYKGYSLLMQDDYIIQSKEYEDYYNHGTACASIILNECPNVEFVIIKIMNGEGKTTLRLVEEALKSLLKTDVKIINMSFATNKVNDSVMYDLCNKLVTENKILISSCANEYSNSYPAIFDNVIGVRGAILENKNAIWYNDDNDIQCIIDNVPTMCCGLNGKFQMRFPNNSFAAAKLSGIVCKILSEYSNSMLCNIGLIQLNILLKKYSIRQVWNKSDLQSWKRKPNEKEWEISNENPLLLKIYNAINEKVKIPDTSEKICNCKLLTSEGCLTMGNIYEVLKHVTERLEININYMDIDKFDLITVGTLTKFFQKVI